MQDLVCIMAGWLAGRLAGWLAGWLAGLLAGLLAGWLVGWPAGWLGDLLVVWLSGSRAGWLVCGGYWLAVGCRLRMQFGPEKCVASVLAKEHVRVNEKHLKPSRRQFA